MKRPAFARWASYGGFEVRRSAKAEAECGIAPGLRADALHPGYELRRLAVRRRAA